MVTNVSCSARLCGRSDLDVQIQKRLGSSCQQIIVCNFKLSARSHEHEGYLKPCMEGAVDGTVAELKTGRAPLGAPFRFILWRRRLAAEKFILRQAYRWSAYASKVCMLKAANCASPLTMSLMRSLLVAISGQLLLNMNILYTLQGPIMRVKLQTETGKQSLQVLTLGVKAYLAPQLIAIELIKIAKSSRYVRSTQ